MRVLDSAIGFCKKYNKKLYLVWPYFKGMNCPFGLLFEKPEIVLSISSPSEYSKFKIVRNLKVARRKIARNFYKLFNDKVIFKKEIYKLMDKKFDFNELAAFNDIRIQTDQRFYSSDKLYSDFRPIPSLLNEIERYRKIFMSTNVMGIHIRRSDHVRAIKHSPTERFIDLIQNEIEKDSTTKFFLATDSIEEEQNLINQFGNRIITHKKPSFSRESIEGIQHALVDLYVLGSTKNIIGSYTSSFSEVAAEIGNIPLEVA